jgi:hypothetical protein
MPLGLDGRERPLTPQVRTNVQPQFNYHEPGRDHRTLPGDKSLCRQPAADARGLSRLSRSRPCGIPEVLPFGEPFAYGWKGG